MPEGHTIHRLARGLRRTLAGAPVAASSPQGRFAADAALLDGHHVERADAWGKELFVTWDHDLVLRVHLGLIGKFRDLGPAPPPPGPNVRLRLAGRSCAWDLSGPAACELIDHQRRREILARLGPDPLRPRADVARVRAEFARRNTPVGALLLDQSVIAGIGNVYRAEILHVAGIDPTRPANSLDGEEFDRLWRITVDLMRTGRRLGRIVTTGARHNGDALHVYHREHCRRCGGPLATVRLAGRPLQHCTTCQR